ncbi:hypothetical protein [Aliiroseovarius crassostreae]|uniref:hypothetical protein n=1 Tax=Aliiroseovarius crassostreae TaxID=154981 RepID=UPI003C79CB97
MMEKQKLKYEEICVLAQKSAELEWGDFRQHGQNLLQEKCLNYGRAWMFFRNPNIAIPDVASVRKCALVVSDKGEVRSTADYQPDMTACMEYLQRMSDHFAEKGL